MPFASLPRRAHSVSPDCSRAKLIIVIAAAMLGTGHFAGRVCAQADSAIISDDAAVFRQHPELESQLRSEIEDLHRDTGVTALLKTVSFLTDDNAASRARKIAEAHSHDQPVAVLLFVRGNHSAGLGVNSALDSLIPAFELAALPVPSGDEKTAAANQLVETYGHFFALVRRYTSSAADHKDGDDQSADGSVGKARQAELWLLFAVLTCAALIVAITAWRCRRPAAMDR